MFWLMVHSAAETFSLQMQSWGISLLLCCSTEPPALTDELQLVLMPADDLRCTFFPSPKCSFIKNANFSNQCQLQQARQHQEKGCFDIFELWGVSLNTT